MIAGDASLNSIGSGSTTSISLRASAGQHRRQLGERARTGLQTDALAALAGVVELEDVLLGGGVLGDDGRGCRHRLVAALALQELERHGTSLGSVDA